MLFAADLLQNFKLLVASQVGKASAHHCTKLIKISQTVVELSVNCRLYFFYLNF